MKGRLTYLSLVSVWIAALFLSLPANAKFAQPKKKLIVVYRSEESAQTSETASSGRLRSRALRAFKKLRVFKVPTGSNAKDLAYEISKDPAVDYVEEDRFHFLTAMPNDTLLTNSWSLYNFGQSIGEVSGVSDADIDATEAWDIEKGKSDTVVAVLDTGVDFSHPDLQGRFWTNPGEIPGDGIDNDGNGLIDDVRGWDFGEDDSDPSDIAGHGTHVAGTIAANANNSQGVTGLNWNAKIMVLKVFQPVLVDGEVKVLASTSDIIEALDYAVAKGAKLSNNSYGTTEFSQAQYDAIARARAAGHILVAASGNSALNTTSNPHFPAAYDLDNVISVAATDNRDEIAGFSNFGMNVDLGAPGVNIASTYPGNRYIYMSGTSMAAPHVAGVISLVQARFPTMDYLTAINQVVETGDPVSSLAGRTRTGRRLNAYKALTTSPSAPSNLSAILQGQDVTLSWQDNSSTEMRFYIESKTAGNYNIIADLPGNNSYFTWKGVLPGTYTFRVRAVSPVGSSASGEVSITVGATVALPAAPTLKSLYVAALNQVNIQWIDNSNNETTFQVYRKATSGSYVQVARLAAGVTSYIDHGVAANVTYTYIVRAANSAGYAVSNALLTQTSAPAAPTDVAASVQAGGKILINWSDRSNNEANFQILRKEGSGIFQIIGFVDANVKRYYDSTAVVGKRYDYRVDSVNGIATVVSNSVSLLVAIPTMPSGVQLQVRSSSQIDVRWTDTSSNELGFYVYRQLSGSADYTLVGKLAAGVTSFADTGLQAGKIYNYRVRSYNGLGTSAPTGVLSATTLR